MRLVATRLVAIVKQNPAAVQRHQRTGGQINNDQFQGVAGQHHRPGRRHDALSLRSEHRTQSGNAKRQLHERDSQMADMQTGEFQCGVTHEEPLLGKRKKRNALRRLARIFSVA